MTFITEADKELNEVRESVNKAILSLSEIITGKVNGYKDYHEKFRNDLRMVFNDLLVIKEKLD
jgi:hypothetical protein